MKNRFYMALGVVLASVVLWSGGVYFLFFEKIKPFSRNFLEAQQAIVATQDKFDQYSMVVSKNISRNEDNFKNIESHLYPHSEDSLYDFARFIEALVEKNNLTHRIEATPQGEGSPVTARISVTGSFSDVMAFIREIENEKYYMRITSLDLRANGNVFSAGLSLSILAS